MVPEARQTSRASTILNACLLNAASRPNAAALVVATVVARGESL
jgi:hypothetical protein